MKTPLPVDQSNSCPTEPDHYHVESNRIAYSAKSVIYASLAGPIEISLANLIFPPTAGNPLFMPLSDDPEYVELALAIADRRVLQSRNASPHPRMITRQLYLLRHVLDWLRSRGVYRLREATSEHMNELVIDFTNRGWSGALDLPARWHKALDELDPESIRGGFHYKRGRGNLQIETLLQPFWRERIGWGGNLPLPEDAKTRIEQIARGPFTDSWHKRSTAEIPPSRFVLRNTLGWLNDLCLLPSTVDRLKRRVVVVPALAARRLAPRAPGRTPNLSVADATRLISDALHLQYEIAPKLASICQDAKAASAAGNHALDDPERWLRNHPLTRQLEELVGRPIERWTTSGTYAKSPHALTINQLIGAVQGACAIVIAAMNARRQREICDRRTGLRVGDLVVLDEQCGLYQASFYIEKTYLDRHTFYINRASADAIRTLETLKNACDPNTDSVVGESIFACALRADHSAGVKHFSFTTDDGRARSLVSFREVTEIDRTDSAPISAHMFRRFYAILYYHQYDHAELRALKQHLRHLDVAMTRVYVTDPYNRPVAEQIRSALGHERFRATEDRRLQQIEVEFADLDEALREVEREKFEQAVSDVLSGRPTAGGFSRIVRKLHRHMLGRSEFADRDDSEHLAHRLIARGYQARPMLHGQCHAPATNRHLKAKCEDDGLLRHDRAGAILCNRCPYHFNDLNYLENLREDLERLKRDASDASAPTLIASSAQASADNLAKLISTLEAQMHFGSRLPGDAR